MKIKDLDRNKRYSLQGMTQEQTKLLVSWLKLNDMNWHSYNANNFFRADSLGWDSEWQFYFPLKTDTPIQTLFYEEEKYIQGNVYLFSNNGENWEEGEFAVEWKDYYYTVNNYDGSLIPYKYMKPIQELEWYVIDEGEDKEFRQITEEDVLILQAEEKRVIKVTNESLIKSLNDYGNVVE